jgi:hypothetical protein
MTVWCRIRDANRSSQNANLFWKIPAAAVLSRRRAIPAALLAALTILMGLIMSPPAKAQTSVPLAVDVKNQSEPVLCAEKDNVSIALTSPQVRSFRIEGAHPVYIGSLQRDSYEADWTDCDMTGDPVFAAPVPPRRVTFYEEVEIWLVGMTFPSFWRPATATVRVGDRVEHNLHLIQVWMIRPNGGEEVLVIYPQDGYWRLRPMTPQGLNTTAYGSSFLIGPIEEEGRPIVRIKEIAFDPPTRTFTVTFERGGSATVKLVQIDQNRNALDVAFDRPISGHPFAMLRSMYITEFNNDAARIAVRENDAKGWREDNIMRFDRARATAIWAGRLSPSQHNTSSPDMIFNGFSEGPKPHRPRAEPPAAAAKK